MIEITDRIYEAALVPELWPAVLDNIAMLSGSASGAVLVFAGQDQPPRYRTTALTEDALLEFITTDLWQRSERVPKLFSDQPPGAFSQFLYLSDFLAEDERERDSVGDVLRGLGLGEQITTVMPMLSGEVVSFTFERWLEQGRHDPQAVSALEELRPHLGRAGLLSARLGLERSRAAVATLEAIGLPAAVLTSSGKVLVANGLLEALATVFRPAAFGGLSISNPAADNLFRQALADVRRGSGSSVCSIPIPGSGGFPPFVLHLLPVRHAANDIFSGADILVVISRVEARASTLSPSVLYGLFDLTPAEARIATALARGRSLADASADAGTTIKTARTYLERVYRKTGTHQQSQLVALLKSGGTLE